MSSEILKIKQYQVTDRNVSENNNSIHKIIFILHSCAEDSLDSAGWEIFPVSNIVRERNIHLFACSLPIGVLSRDPYFLEKFKIVNTINQWAITLRNFSCC